MKQNSNKQLAHEIHNFFINNELTLSIAESCTGGNLSACLTQIPGSSQYFLGSIIAYCNSIKQTLLSIDLNLINQHGAVSNEVVSKMAEKILTITNSDYSLAVSGIAGPDGGTPTKPVGFIWMSIGSKNQKTISWNNQFNGTRMEIIDQAIHQLLFALLKLIKSKQDAIIN